MSNSNLFIVPEEHTKNYKTISTYCCEDSNLSWKAKGLWMYLITRPPNWIIRLQDLKNRSKNGSDSLSSGMKELIENKYVFRILKKNPQQRIESYGYLVFEIPQDNLNVMKINKICPGWQSDMKNSEKPLPENPLPENPLPENPDYNNKNINNNLIISKDIINETSFPDVITDKNKQQIDYSPDGELKPKASLVTTDKKPNNLLERMEQENETYNKSNKGYLEQVEPYLKQNSDIQKIIDYWNNLPKPLSDHKDKDTKTYLQICQNLQKLLKKNYSDKITSSIQTYFDLIKDPYFKLSLVAPGVKVDLSNFLNINSYLKNTIKDPDLLIPWFDKCSAQTLDQLKEKYSKETKDLYPDITNALKNEWHNLINENKKFTVAEENFLKKTAISTYNYFKNIKDFKNDTYYKKHYPVTCIKFIVKVLLINNPDIEMVPGWLWSDNFFSKVDNYLRKIGYIEDGYDAHISRSPMRTELTKPEDLENIRKEEEEKEKEIRDTCLTSDDFL